MKFFICKFNVKIIGFFTTTLIQEKFMRLLYLFYCLVSVGFFSLDYAMMHSTKNAEALQQRLVCKDIEKTKGILNQLVKNYDSIVKLPKLSLKNKNLVKVKQNYFKDYVLWLEDLELNKAPNIFYFRTRRLMKSVFQDVSLFKGLNLHLRNNGVFYREHLVHIGELSLIHDKAKIVSSIIQQPDCIYKPETGILKTLIDKDIILIQTILNYFIENLEEITEETIMSECFETRMERTIALASQLLKIIDPSKFDLDSEENICDCYLCNLCDQCKGDIPCIAVNFDVTHFELLIRTVSIQAEHVKRLKNKLITPLQYINFMSNFGLLMTIKYYKTQKLNEGNNIKEKNSIGNYPCDCGN